MDYKKKLKSRFNITIIYIVLGIVIIASTFLTKTDNTCAERTVSIIHKAKSTAFSIYSMVLSVAIIILSFLSLHEIAKWIAYSVLLLMAIYWICYLVYQKKS